MYNKIIKIASTIGATLRTGSIFGEDDIGLFIIKGGFVLIFFLVAFFCLASPMGRKLIKAIRGK